MSLLARIAEIENEIDRTQKNKATEKHLGLLKAKLAKLKSEVSCSFLLARIMYAPSIVFADSP